jgi:predicted MFS family arabinose efflux permease
MSTAATADEPEPKPNRRKPVISLAEWGLLLVLAAVQFTNMMDFMIVMPLAPQYIRQLSIRPEQFSDLVAVYGFAAGIAALFASAVLDRFDRKTALLGLYAGFTVSTLLCAVAPSFEWLVLARTAAGAFGGVLGVAVLAIVGDLFADYRRATAMGAIMSAFSLASIVGIPVALELAQAFDTSAPFWFLTALSAVVWVPALLLLPSLRGHLGAKHTPVLSGVRDLLREPNHQRAYLFMTAIVMGTFVLVPYIAAYLVQNVGRSESEVKFVYIAGGLCTLVSMNVIGRLADRFGKLRLFRIMALAQLIPTLLLTNLPPASLAVALTVTTIFMVTTSGRMVPAMALLTACAAPRVRGGFLSLSTAVQFLAQGLAAKLSGKLLGMDVDGHLTGYGLVGLVAAAAMLTSVALAGWLRPAAEEALAPVAEEGPAVAVEPLPAET